MKIGIIIYSQTGHTRDVATQLAEQLQENHTVSLEFVTLSGDEKGDKRKITLEKAPAVSEYDCLILGAPVHAFSLAPGMEVYLNSIPDFAGKPVGLLMTQHFPYPWMGGNRALGQFRSICRKKGAEIKAEGIINWSSKKRPEQIQHLVKDFSNRFTP